VVRTPATLFRVLAIAEVTSWPLLLPAPTLRPTAGLAIATVAAGSIHGFVFLSYGATAVLVASNNRWRPWPTIVAIVSAIVPSATVPVEIWLARTGRLAGEWRTTEAADPTDRLWYDGLLRWFLLRPWVLAVLIVLAVAAIFTVLVIIGPPGGR
jgi:integral membrane protein